MKIFIIILLTFAVLLLPVDTYASEDPLSVPNNKFGVHIMDENDLDKAAELVNTNGDWGYVTLVIRADERKIDRWQRVFDDMRRKHLIPIIRIASTQGDGYWNKLESDDINNWAFFLNSLNWVTKNRYVIVGNEVNHAEEWGGELNPKEYSEYLFEFSKAMKDASDDFFIIPAGLDASAPSEGEHMSEDEYLEAMVRQKNEVFTYIDGWASHSYPNPAFSGSWEDLGRGTVRTFEWEMEVLKSLGVRDDWPIFITETGWGDNIDGKYPGLKSESEISNEIVSAFENVWNDDRVVAVTPFIINHQGEPFEQFSWLAPSGKPYEYFQNIKDLNKTYGEPTQIVDGKILTILVPEILSSKFIYSTFGDEDDDVGLAIARNLGQSIWEKGGPVFVEKGTETIAIEPYSESKPIEPLDSGLVIISSEYGQKNTLLGLFEPFSGIIKRASSFNPINSLEVFAQDLQY